MITTTSATIAMTIATTTVAAAMTEHMLRSIFLETLVFLIVVDVVVVVAKGVQSERQIGGWGESLHQRERERGGGGGSWVEQACEKCKSKYCT